MTPRSVTRTEIFRVVQLQNRFSREAKRIIKKASNSLLAYYPFWEIRRNAVAGN